MLLRSRHAAGTCPTPKSRLSAKGGPCVVVAANSFALAGHCRPDGSEPLVWRIGERHRTGAREAPSPPAPLPRGAGERGEFDPASEGPAREARPLRARMTRPPPPEPLGEVELRCCFDPATRQAPGSRRRAACPRRRTSCGRCSEFIRPCRRLPASEPAEGSRDRASGGPIDEIHRAPEMIRRPASSPKKILMAPCRASTPLPFPTAHAGSCLVGRSAMPPLT
jgi:hypothetical protein